MNSTKIMILLFTTLLILNICKSIGHTDIMGDPNLVGKQLECIKGLKQCTETEEENRSK